MVAESAVAHQQRAAAENPAKQAELSQCPLRWLPSHQFEQVEYFQVQLLIYAVEHKKKHFFESGESEQRTIFLAGAVFAFICEWLLRTL